MCGVGEMPFIPGTRRDLFANGPDIVKPYNGAAVCCADIYASIEKGNTGELKEGGLLLGRKGICLCKTAYDLIV